MTFVAEAAALASSSASTFAASYLFDEEDDDLTTTTSTNDNTIHGSNSGGGGGNTVCQSVVAIAYSYPLDGDMDADDDDGNDITFVCELLNGDVAPITATPEQVTEMRNALNNGTLVSAVSTIIVEEVVVSTEEGGMESFAAAVNDEQGDEELMLMVQEQMESLGGGNIQSVTLPPGSIRVRTDVDKQLARRSLANYSPGNVPVLAVRVTDVNGLAPRDAKYISDKIFGTYGDKVTVKSQMAACSYGAINIVNDYGNDNEWILSKLSAPGVIDVTVDVSINPFPPNGETLYNAYRAALRTKLGFGPNQWLPGPFAHIMFIIEKLYGGGTWAANGGVNTWNSHYNGDVFAHPKLAMHEFGHNLNLGHSGAFNEKGEYKEYGDWSCIMGTGNGNENVGGNCYNAAKTHQLIMSNGVVEGKSGIAHIGNWYNASRVETWTPGASGSMMWTGTLVGVAEYGQISNGGGGADRRLVLRIVHNETSDYFVGFNRKTGMTNESWPADKVTVYEAAAGGVTYSQSTIQAKLGQGESFSVPDWLGNASLRLEIFTDEIRTDVVPGYAKVRAELIGGDGPANPPTNPPTKSGIQPTTPPPTPDTTIFPSLPPYKEPEFPTYLPTSFPPTPNPTPQPPPTAQPATKKLPTTTKLPKPNRRPKPSSCCDKPSRKFRERNPVGSKAVGSKSCSTVINGSWKAPPIVGGANASLKRRYRSRRHSKVAGKR
ncbi:hypothetical protein ACHAWU_004392 [Discostella pseudostelligera]|uniref:Peptidase M11 gametolysin domain-containing protein n=1 Tax=Discostella pseudostelligera TaxID=259834 RepID=A0ABD3N916_9STRA